MSDIKCKIIYLTDKDMREMKQDNHGCFNIEETLEMHSKGILNSNNVISINNIDLQGKKTNSDTTIVQAFCVFYI